MEDREIITPDIVDLSNCDREAIHIPGRIQPYGVMLVLAEPNLRLVQVSRNTLEFLDLHPQDLLDRPLDDFLDSQQLDLIKGCIAQDFENVNPLKLTFNGRLFDGIIHRSDCVLILELEPTRSHQRADFVTFYHLIKGAIARFQNASTLNDLCDIIVEQVRQLTGFDRVMVYRFDEQGAGQVIAEDKRDDLEPYLGLHYPASDIPKQARKLYALNWLRLVFDANYQPTELIPDLNPITNSPLDMSHAVLRSVSPLHVEYMHNMGLTASMSISLLKDRELWGLVACHHYSPKVVSYEIRTACEFLGQVMSLELALKEDNEDLDYKMKLKSLQSQFIESISEADDSIEGLIGNPSNLLELVNASGAAIYCAQEQIAIGKTPVQSQLQDLLNWTTTQMQSESIYETNCLPQVYPPAEQFKNLASGMLALCISKVQKFYILWFRPEVIQTVNWGGNPNKPVEVHNNGEVRLSPRKSFALWQELVSNQSIPWKRCEIEAAIELRSSIVGIVLKGADELAKVNLELARSNEELDAFAYIASHDLKEPLRGIHNYSSFLLEDYENVLSEDGIGKLQTLMRLTRRMEDLIESLLHYSRLGRSELFLQQTDLNQLVNEVLDIFKIGLPKTGVTISIPRPLPMVYCDRVQISELFSNLIGNAIKYNDKPQKIVEIGYLEAEEPERATPIFYIKDNGIGIREKHLETIFRIFKRLHPANKYGGGTGAGLTIAKKIVERHNGKIWVRSVYGEGSTFYFSFLAAK
ncbi:MAG: GAF domain-containing protein [Hydrococcus sp. Prado102]|jgi:light-regulated signal transduction histidine kinase (bacteriophytochrome)|nr:GAF domain-containing protein [Hydrococcus sp. Prado102]